MFNDNGIVMLCDGNKHIQWAQSKMETLASRAVTNDNGIIILCNAHGNLQSASPRTCLIC